MAKTKKKATAAKKTTLSEKMKKPQKPQTKVKTKAVKKTAATTKKKKVSPIPKGYNSVTPYLIVSNAAKAIEFYKKAFEAKEVMRMQKPDGKVGHAEIKIGDAKIMLADPHPEMNARSPQEYGGSPVSIHLYMKDVDAVVKRSVTAGARLVRPVEDMFYGDRSGLLSDPFGHTWSVATHIEDVTPAKMRKRMAELSSKK